MALIFFFFRVAIFHDACIYVSNIWDMLAYCIDHKKNKCKLQS